MFEIYLHQRLSYFFYMKSDYISILTLVKEHLNILTSSVLLFLIVYTVNYLKYKKHCIYFMLQIFTLQREI